MAPEVGIDPKLIDAELVTLAVMQGLSGLSPRPGGRGTHAFTCGTCFPYLPQQPGFSKRVRPSAMAAGGAALLAGAFSLSCAARDRVASPTRLAWFHQLRRSWRMRCNDGGPWTLAGELR